MSGESARTFFGTFAYTTWCPSFSIFVTTRGSSPNTVPSTRLPSFANVAYARVISSTLTGSTPSPIAK